MPQNLTGVSGSFPVQTAPVAGDPRTVSSVVTPYQAAANRAEYLKLHVDTLETNVTALQAVSQRKIRNYASIAAMKASTDHVDGEVSYIVEYGLYSYDTSEALANDDIRTIKPTDVMGNGAWRLIYPATLHLLRKTGGGTNTTVNTGTGTAFTDTHSYTVDFVADDLVYIDGWMNLFMDCPTTTTVLSGRIRVTGPGGFDQKSDLNVDAGLLKVASGDDGYISPSMLQILQISTSGTYTVSFQLKKSAASSTVTVYGSSYKFSAVRQ